MNYYQLLFADFIQENTHYLYDPDELEQTEAVILVEDLLEFLDELERNK